MDSSVPQVYDAISRVSADLAKVGIGKDGRNQQQNYSFRGIEQVLNALSPALVTHGLVVLPKIVKRECVERVTAKGTAQYFVTVIADFEMVCVADGSRHTVTTHGEAQDTADKATNKAMSAAYKYFAFLTFCIPLHGVMDDADATTPDENVPTAPAGFADWLADMEATADTGIEALRAAWKGSKPEYRDYATRSGAFEPIKAKAQKVAA